MSSKKVFLRSFGGLVAALAGVLTLTTSLTAASATSATEAAADSAPPIASAAGGPIKNRATNYCLDANYEGRVYTHPCNGGNFQNWTTVWAGYGMKIVNIATAQCLTIAEEGTSVFTLPCTWGVTGQHQKWISSANGLIPVETDEYEYLALYSDFSREVRLGDSGTDFARWYNG